MPETLRQQAGDPVRRARLLLAFLCIGVVVPTLTFFLQHSGGGTPEFMTLGIGTAAISGSLMLLMRLSGSYVLVGHLLVATIFGVTGYIVLSAGGRAPIGFFGSILVPPLAVLLCGVRAGVVWSLLCLSVMSLVLWGRSAGVDFPVQMDPGVQARWTLLGGMLMTSASLCLAVVYESLRTRALLDLEAARQRAEEEHAARIAAELRFRDHLEEQVAARTRELDLSRQQLRNSERLASVGTLAAGIAHQINNPIGTILISADYALQRQVEEGAEDVGREVLEEVVQQARRCGRIVHSILQFSRDEPTEKWPENLNDVVRRSCELSRGYAEERRARVDLEVDRDELRVRLSPIEIEQVVVNLVRNAIESRPEGASVRVETSAEGEHAVLRISDDGGGIEPELLQRIFDPFFTTRLAHGGSGLGLSVAHGIVTDHGGRMHVDSVVGEGSVVRVELPLCAE